jgi:basic membrane lipoprotein Med (substrate-binding protein (PBP1-ABC) superfamily)
MRRFAVLALCALASVSGCKRESKPNAPATFGPEAGAGAFKVALLTPGSIRDGGWNQSAYEGLEKIKSELGAEIAYQETKTPQDFESGFRDFAARGFKLVFGHGFEFQDAAAKVAEEYPDTVFVTTSGSTVRENVAPIVFELEEATYLLGFCGARPRSPACRRGGRVRSVGGQHVPGLRSRRAPAKPDAEVVIAHRRLDRHRGRARGHARADCGWGRRPDPQRERGRGRLSRP